jgi:hypothetical protein
MLGGYPGVCSPTAVTEIRAVPRRWPKDADRGGPYRTTPEPAGSLGFGVAEEQQTSERTDDASVSGKLTAKVAEAQAGRKGVNRDQLQRTVQQTGPSRFARLYDLLGEDSIQELPAVDEDIWNDLRRQAAIDVQAIVTLPAITKMMGMVPLLESYMAMAEMFGEAVDEETQSNIGMMKQFGQLGGDRQVTIIAAVAGTPRFKFVSHLDREYLQVDDPMELEVS